jgi:hypothetical protein
MREKERSFTACHKRHIRKNGITFRWVQRDHPEQATRRDANK